MQTHKRLMESDLMDRWTKCLQTNGLRINVAFYFVCFLFCFVATAPTGPGPPHSRSF